MISTTCSSPFTPAQLDAALTALAGAIQGQGASLGHNLVRGNTYFSQMLPLWPTVVADLKTARAGVEPVRALDARTSCQSWRTRRRPGRRSTRRRAPSARLWAEVPTLAGRLSQLLTAIQQPYDILAADSGPFLKDISQNPKEISQLLQGFDTWAKAWTRLSPPARTSPHGECRRRQPGRSRACRARWPAVGGLSRRRPRTRLREPSTYTSAGSIPGNAVLAREAAVALSRSASSVPAQVMAAKAEQSAVSQVVAAMGGQRPEPPAVSSLLLSPVLASLVSAR